ncbi:MAG: hypothetical protein M0Q95_16985, partial [Porticoccaceae bacterium]|nr:hypothetical protein [Porticoccaceae bacterium]
GGERASSAEVVIDYRHDDQQQRVAGSGSGAIEAAVAALTAATGSQIRVVNYHEHALGTGSEVEAACYIEMQIDDQPTIFGVGVDRNIIGAAIKALFNGLNRHGVNVAMAPVTEAVSA